MKSTPPTATAGERSQWLTYKDVLVELSVSRSTLDKWRATGQCPKFLKLPNGEMRLRRADFDAWVNRLQKVA
jgi:predicted DNA-binding transcriptional regulator AlpA